MSFISDPLWIISILCMVVVLSEWLVQHTFCKHLGTALLVIIVTAILANTGIVPSASNAPPLYNIIFAYLAPISIFYLLLEVNLRHLKRAGFPMLITFLLGSAGTLVGVLTAMTLVNGPEMIGESYNAIAGMFAGTYSGGSINFNAVALHYGVTHEGALYAGSVAVDNIITAIWMVITIAIPKLLMRANPGGEEAGAATLGEIRSSDQDGDTESLNPRDLGVMIGLGVFCLLISNGITGLLAEADIAIPSILILTTLALMLAQFNVINELRGSRALGMFSVYIFLAVIGAYCELATLAKIGDLGITLSIFATVLVLVHGIIMFGIGRLLYPDWELLSIASQANIGGSTTALALARSFNRNDLLLPAILVGSLGNAIGTYLGFIVADFI